MEGGGGMSRMGGEIDVGEGGRGLFWGGGGEVRSMILMLRIVI